MTPRRSFGRRARSAWVVGPALAGLVLCAGAAWGYRVDARNQTDFAAHAVTTTAIISSVVNGVVQETESGHYWDQYANVRFSGDGSALRAQVWLQHCPGACPLTYRAGEAIRIAYDPRYPARAMLASRVRSVNPLLSSAAIQFLALLGVIALAGAAANLFLGTGLE